MHSWASRAEKNIYLEQACQEEILSHSSLFFCTFSPQMGVLNFVWVEKKIRHLCFLLAFLFWKALLRRSSLCTEPSSFPLVIACVWSVLPEFNSCFQGSKEAQISLVIWSKGLRFHVASWESYRKPRDIPGFSTGLSQHCFWTKVHAKAFCPRQPLQAIPGISARQENKLIGQLTDQWVTDSLCYPGCMAEEKTQSH